MQAILHHAEEVLRQHPAPAMELEELHDRLRELRPTCTPVCDSLRRILEDNPHRFRVVDPWRGPWIHGHDRDRPDTDGVVVIAIDGVCSEGDPSPGSALLRESVRWIARGTDLQSTGGVARLYALILAEDAARLGLRRRAA